MIKRFNEPLNQERSQIETSSNVYKSKLNKLKNESFFLRPLPPKDMIPLKPYSQILFEIHKTSNDGITEYNYEELEIRTINYKNNNKISILIQLTDEIERLDDKKGYIIFSKKTSFNFKLINFIQNRFGSI